MTGWRRHRRGGVWRRQRRPVPAMITGSSPAMTVKPGDDGSSPRTAMTGLEAPSSWRGLAPPTTACAGYDHRVKPGDDS
jgi:hypothetical protein